MELVSKKFDFNNELEKQRELFKDCFPENIGTTVVEQKHYNWKFHSFPHSVRSYEYASFIEDDIVGYYAAIPYQYKIGDKKVGVAMVCDVMTSSKYRGKGIFTKLGRYSLEGLKEEGLAFTMGYPRRKEVIPGHLKVGWEIIFDMPLYANFLNANSLLSSKKLGFIAPIVNFFLSTFNHFASSKVNGNYHIEIFESIDPINGYDSFVSKWMNSVQNALDKRTPFAKWRYSAPDSGYKFFVARRNDELVGFIAVRKVIKNDVPSYGILDFMVLPAERDCIGSMIKSLKRAAVADHVEALLCMMSRSSAKKYLLIKNGFVKTPVFFQLIINRLNRTIDETCLKDESHWHLMWVDSDDL